MYFHPIPLDSDQMICCVLYKLTLVLSDPTFHNMFDVNMLCGFISITSKSLFQGVNFISSYRQTPFGMAMVYINPLYETYSI